MMNTSLAGIDELLRLHPPTHPALVEVMVRDYRVAVYRLALSLLADPDDAEDATQETFIKAARYLARYRAGTNFRAWIFKITVNTCRSLLRKRTARANLQRVLNMRTTQSGSQVEPEQLATQRDARTQLWDLVGRLPEKQRLALILHQGHDLPIAEVAQITGANPKTVYSRLYAAYQALRGMIQQSVHLNLFENE
jgi:RNA polymerase sigma-70 factor, ECF subfamily